MSDHNEANERIKRKYLVFLKDGRQRDEATVDAVAKAIARFESDTKYRDFKAFHFEMARAFKCRLSGQTSSVSGETLSKATQYSTLSHLRRFFQWLSREPGYKSRIQYSDADYFSLSGKDSRVATARRERAAPTLEQIKHVLRAMPVDTEIDRRDRALIAFTLLTGARDGAVASMKLTHVDLIAGSVFQDAREVRTKFSKSFTTYFFQVGDEVREIVEDWIRFLQTEKLWGHDDPLFPTTAVGQDSSLRFEAQGLKRGHWSSAAPVRGIFRKAFQRAGLPYFNPHSFRKTLARLGEAKCRTPEEFKAWSQNLGHEGVLTTFRSYGEVDLRRQGELIQSLAIEKPAFPPDSGNLARLIGMLEGMERERQNRIR